MKVSVVIPAHNYGRFIGDAVRSVLTQTLAPHEIIVVDDGSTDDTARVLAGFGDRIHVIHQQNQGSPTARNAGIAHASGDLIAFLDADDVWLPRKLERQVDRFLAEPDLGLVHCGIMEVDANSNPVRVVLDGIDGWIATDLLLFRRNILGGGSGMVVSRKACDAVGGFDPRTAPVEDLDLWYQVARRFRVGFVPEVLLKYRYHGDSQSRNLKKRERAVLVIFEKAFQDADPALGQLRRRAYGNMHLGMAGFYVSARQPLEALRHLLHSLWLTPDNAGRLLTYPLRHRRRQRLERAFERPVAAASDRR